MAMPIPGTAGTALIPIEALGGGHGRISSPPPRAQGPLWRSTLSSKTLAGVIAGLFTVIVVTIGALVLGAGGMALAGCTRPAPAFAAGTAASVAPGGITVVGPSGATWTGEQLDNATTIATTGVRGHVPPRAWIIAIATAMQESHLINRGHSGAANDHDSLGLFQQRPSQGWGSPAQILDPAHAAGQFFAHLTAVAGWQDLPLTVAAQRVQNSAYPDAYAAWEDDAIAVLTAVGPAATGTGAAEFASWLGACAALGSDGAPGGAAETLPDDFVLPVGTPPAIVTALNWALAQLGTPYAFGGDCTNAHSGVSARQCDCSSLVQQAYRAAGIALPRTTAQQVHAGSPIRDHTALAAGDLLFIPGSDGTTASPRHVGLYLGNGLLVQAPHTGDHVKITRLSAWSGRLSQVRRVVST
jgi:cell wall-associated NlpC family hydrolase